MALRNRKRQWRDTNQANESIPLKLVDGHPLQGALDAFRRSVRQDTDDIVRPVSEKTDQVLEHIKSMVQRIESLVSDLSFANYLAIAVALCAVAIADMYGAAFANLPTLYRVLIAGGWCVLVLVGFTRFTRRIK